MIPEVLVNTVVSEVNMKIMNKIPFSDLMEREIDKIRKKTEPVNSWHEGYGILIEEVSELFDEVKKKHNARDNENMTKELTQIAAVCQKMYEDLI